MFVTMQPVSYSKLGSNAVVFFSTFLVSFPDRGIAVHFHYDLILSCRPLQPTENVGRSSSSKYCCMTLNGTAGSSHIQTVKIETNQTKNNKKNIQAVSQFHWKRAMPVKEWGNTVSESDCFNAWILLASRKLRLICALCCRFVMA